MIKKNIKVISVFILGVVCALGITISAYSITGKNILVKATGWNVKNLEEAVGYLKDEDRCRGLHPRVAYVTSGDVNTAGSVVQIGDDEFYVIGQGTGKEAGKTKLLTKYCLGGNGGTNQVDGGQIEVSFSSSDYWSGKLDQYTDNYIYDSNSLLHSYVNNYVNKISNLGVSNVSGRLLTKDELNALGSYAAINASYWTGTLAWTDAVWVSYGTGAGYTSRLNIRPVILVPTNKIG